LVEEEQEGVVSDPSGEVGDAGNNGGMVRVSGCASVKEGANI
jgi:hypothetical protein